MSRLEATVMISRPAKEIFAFLAVPGNHARFIPGMVEFKQTSPGLFGQVGATARGMRRDFGLSTQVRYEITQVQPNKKLDMKGIMGPIRFEDGYVLEAMGSSTRVNFWLELNLSGLVKLARPLIQWVGKTHAAETLENLKQALEMTAGFAHNK